MHESYRSYFPLSLQSRYNRSLTNGRFLNRDRLMKKISLVSIFLITTIVALLIAFYSSQTQLSATRAELTKLRNDYKVLNPSRPDLVRSIAVPAFKRNQWQWKIDLPDSNRYVLRMAYDDIPAQGMPTSVLPLVSPALPSEEFLLTATVLNENGRWKMNWANGDFVANR